MACLWCTSKRPVRENLMVEIKILKIDVVFFLNFVNNSQRRTCYMVFRNRTIKMSNKDDQES